jgi:hypothetical protein
MVKRTNIQVFIDLENVQPPQAEERARKKVTSLLTGIHNYVESNGYSLGRVWACARMRGPEKTRKVIDTVFADFGAVMFWTKKIIADTEIRQELIRCWDTGVLSPAILFISSDNDFAGVLYDLKGAGFEVLVSGAQVGGVLRQSANRVVSFADIT